MQATTVIMREKKNSSAPVIIAPIMLVAAKVMARSITEVKIVPKIPIKRAVMLLQIQQLRLALPRTNTKKERANAPTAIPNTTHKNTGGTVMVAVMVKNAVTIPIKTLAITARQVQLILGLQ